MQVNTNNIRSKRIEEKETLIQQLLSKYFPYWRYFLLSIVIGISLAFAYLRFTKPVYEAKATLLIKDVKKGNEESKMATSLNQVSSNVIVENEIEILQSFTLMENTVKALNLYAPVYQQEKYQSLPAYATSPIVIEIEHPDSIKVFHQKDSVRRYQKIFFEYDEKSGIITVEDQRYKIEEWNCTPFGKLKFVRNKKYVKQEEPTRLYFSLVNPRTLVPGLLNQLTVEPSSKLSSFVNLRYQDEVPRRAEDILNQLITSYRNAELDEKNELAKSTLLFVTKRLDLIAGELDSIERKIQQYKSGKGAVDIGKQGQLYLENVSANDQKVSELSTQLSVLNQVEQFVSDERSSDRIIPSTLGIDDPILSQLIEKLYSSELQYEKLRKTVGENNPALISINDQRNLLKASILQNIRSQKQSLNAARRNISSTTAEYNSVLQVVPQKERQLLDISRERQIKENVYAFLLQKKEESELAYASTISSSRVIDLAHVNFLAVRPQKRLVYLIAVFGALCINTLFVFLRELFLNKIKYRHEILDITELPIIGEIDFDTTKRDLVVNNTAKSVLVEQFRKLRISLPYLNIDNENKTVLVTSSIAGEGKSFVAANLAISLSLSGKKVALIDLDMYKPYLSKLFGLPNQAGISEFLEGSKCAEEIIRNIPSYEKLSFLNAGSNDDNLSSTEKLEKLTSLMKYLHLHNDIILIDSPPIQIVNDAYIISGLCDATLFVVRQNYTPKMMIRKIDEDKEINPLKNPAIVFNGIKTRGFLKNYRKYGYDAGYFKDQTVGKVKEMFFKYNKLFQMTERCSCLPNRIETAKKANI